MLFYVSIFYLLFYVHKISSSVITCEGFIESTIEIEFSEIKVKVNTYLGNLEYVAKCDLRGGYFQVPFYDEGKYLVKIIAPDGYIFDPEVKEIEIDNNVCSQQLNFKLAGIQVSGKVSNGEITSLVMGLYQEGNLLVKTDVDKEGNYNFVTRPGDYVISPFSAPKLCLNQGTVKITVGSVPVTVNPDFRLDGYNLVVNVKDKEGNPFPTSTVLLSSDNEINFTKPQMGAEYPFSQNVGHKWFYRWLTDNLGSATIVCLPSGKYIIDAENFLNNVKAIFGQKIIEMNSNNEVNISVISFDVFGTATDNHHYKNALYKYEVNSGSKASNNESNNVTTSMVDFSTVLSVVLAFVALFIMCIFTFFQIYICLSDKMNSARIESNDNYHRLDDKMTTNNHLIIGMRENNNEMRNHINNGNQQLTEQINNNHQQLSQENQQLRTDMNNNHQELMNVFNQLNNTVITNKTVLENKTKFIDSKVDAVSDVVRKMKVENNLR